MICIVLARAQRATDPRLGLATGETARDLGARRMPAWARSETDGLGTRPSCVASVENGRCAPPRLEVAEGIAEQRSILLVALDQLLGLVLDRADFSGGAASGSA